MRSPRLSGTVLLDQIRVIVEAHGRAPYERALSTLPASSRAEIAALIPVSWVEVGIAMELKNAVARELGMDQLDFQRWVVRAAAERTISKFWRALLSLASDHAIAKRTPLLYRKTFDRGELAVIEVGETRATYELRGWPNMAEYDAIGLATGLEVVFVFLNRRHGRVRISRQGDLVHFHATWRPEERAESGPSERPRAPRA